MDNRPPLTKLIPESALDSPKYDGLIFIHCPGVKLQSEVISSVLVKALQYDPSLKTEIGVVPVSYPAGRVVLVPTGLIDVDYDDVRIFKYAAEKGVQRALKAGIKKPLLVLEDYGDKFTNTDLVVLLSVLQALYVPIQVREFNPSKAKHVEYLGVYTANNDKTAELCHLAEVLETGRRVACDIGDADPERMSPSRIEEYIYNIFSGSSIKLSTVKDLQQIKKEYPLFEAVNRAASNIERHQGCIVYMEYNPPSKNVTETLFLVGKGVTFDTGGADVKINGAMVSMSRDKCGAAAVIGFMHIVEMMQPKDIRVVAAASLVRNSIGSDSYVPDEVITARSGTRVRVVNTDAEGRMIMADVLCRMKELALDAVNPHLFTVATLTGHAYLTVGDGYSIVMDNGPAKRIENAERLRRGGDSIGDVFEISTIRKEDITFQKGQCFGDDVRQGTNQPSVKTCRGHQAPAAFLLLASGLDKHGSASEKPLKYSHLDIAASSGSVPDPATGAPVLALAQTYLFKK